MALLGPDEVAKALGGLHDWDGDTIAIRRTAVLRSFRSAIDVVVQVSEVAEELDHHPDMDIRWRTLLFECSTHSANGVTEKDIDLAGRIDAIIAAAAQT